MPVLRQWKKVLVISLITAILTYGVSKLFIPKTYKSTAVVFVKKDSAMSGLLQNLPINIAGGSGSVDYYEALLTSKTMLRNLLDKLDLRKNTDFVTGKERRERDYIETLQDMLAVATDQKGNIEVSISGRNPNLCAKIANTMISLLDTQVVSESRRKVDFLTNRLAETSSDLKAAEDKLIKYSQNHDIASIDDETKAFIDKLGQIDSALLQLDIQLAEVDSELANAGDVSSLVDKEVKQKSLNESKNYLLEQRQQMLDKLKQFPSISADYARIKRSVMLLNRTFEVLTEQYQLARITQSGEDGDYQIIDKAYPDPKPIAPKSGLNAVMGFMLAFFIAAIFINIKSAIKPKI